MKKSFLLLSLAFSYFLFSCAAPSPIIKLQPIEHNTKWNNGREFVIIEKDGIKIITSFYRNTEENLIFDFMIENTSSRSVLIDPSIFSIFAEKDSQTIEFKAINPEDKIFEIDQSQNKLIAANKNAWVGDILIEAVDLTTTAIVAANDEDNSEIHFEDYSYRVSDRFAERENREYYFHNNIDNLVSARFIWENNTIRKTNLDPSYYLDGQIYFKRLDDFDNLNLKIPIGNNIFKIKFKQRIHHIR